LAWWLNKLFAEPSRLARPQIQRNSRHRRFPDRRNGLRSRGTLSVFMEVLK